jgi:predicted CxxxxCH...CXXCH cytochrome family protein
LTTLDVSINPETPANPASVTYAIRINGGAFVNQYVQANGSIGASAVWQNDATWGTKTVTGLANSTLYTFNVQARNTPLTTTVWGPTASGTTSGACIATAPTALAAAAGTTTTSIPLTWTTGANTNYFRVYRDGVQVSTDGAVLTGSFTDSGPLDPGTTYSYTVKGHNTANNCDSTASGAFNKSTLANTPVAPTVTNVNATSVSVAVNSDGNSAEATYALRANGGATYVQANGTLGASLVWQTAAVWGTQVVTGLSAIPYTFTVIARNGNGELVQTAYGPASSPAVTPHLMSPTTITSCSGCHGYTSAFTDATGTRNNPAGAFIGDHNKHVVKVKTDCSVCHVAPAGTTSSDFPHRTGNIQMQAAISGGSYTRGTSFAQTNTLSTTGCSNISCHGGNNPTPQWGVGTATCISCHGGVVTAANASIATNGSVTNRDAVKNEFNLAWGHKPSTRATVVDADCIVCHLEGNFTTQQTSTYHADGYINLRNPDGVGEEAIKDMSGATYSFPQFSTSYAALSRSSTGTTSNNPDNVLTQKFCLACHDSNGATNTTAVTSYTTGTIAKQYMPFGGVYKGSTYSLANGASITGGVISAKTQFATTNSSFHPIMGPRFKGYPTTALLAAPYNNFTRTAGTKSNGVVMNCFDCHNAPTTPLTNRTIVAHGNANTLRGTVYVASPTLCTTCHLNYSASTSNHAAGSAFASATTTRSHTTTTCHNCHGSATTAPARPIRAADYHGFNKLLSGANWPTINARPFGFIRNTARWTYQRPLTSPDTPTGSATCQASPCSSDMGSNTYVYTPGGAY